MSQHKAPTAITIAPTSEKTGVALMVEKYWKVGAIVVVGITALIIFRANARQAKRTESDSHWVRLLALAGQDTNRGILKAPPEELRKLESELKGTPAGGWALYIGATTAVEERKFDEAESMLGELKSSYPNHALLKQVFRENDAAATSSPVDRLLAHIQAERKFSQDHAGLFENPALPADAPKVKITTDRGAIVVGLYADRAPKHVENFIKLVRSGYYNGTKFHGIFQGEYVAGGDPNSIDQGSSTWGRGGPDYTLDREPSAIRHFAWVISAAPAPSDATKSSGSQFVITTASVHRLDQDHVPFGMVVEGQDILSAIEDAPLAETSFSVPATPVAIVSTEVL